VRGIEIGTEMPVGTGTGTGGGIAIVRGSLHVSKIGTRAGKTAIVIDLVRETTTVVAVRGQAGIMKMKSVLLAAAAEGALARVCGMPVLRCSSVATRTV
jgi:hypothetical protein